MFVKSSLERVLNVGLFAFFVAVIAALLLSVSGCCLFDKTRVEARADYNILAKDASVSLVAVGYCGEE